jgi:phytoene dehydrogenase-like protein
MATRRDFIKTVVLASGTVFTGFGIEGAAQAAPSPFVRSLNHKQAHMWLRNPSAGIYPKAIEEQRVDVVIVGAGASGLAAAWKLRATGARVLLLDGEGVGGGTMRSSQWNGVTFPVGSTYFVRYNNEYKAFYDAMNAKPVETGEDALWFPGKGPVVDWWNPGVIGSMPLPMSDIDAFRKFRDVLQAMDEIPRYPLSRARPEDLSTFDLVSAQSFVAGFGSERLTRTLDLYSRSVLGAPLNDVNAYALLNFYAFEFGDSFSIPCYTTTGGLAGIADGASTHFASDLKPNALVTSIVQESPGNVAVDYRTADGALHRVRAKAAIVAVQKRIASVIVPDLPQAQKEAMRRVTYAPYVTVALCSKEPLFPSRAFDFWFDDAQNRFTDVIDVTSSMDAAAKNMRTENFVYMLSSARPMADRAKLEDDAYLAHLAQELAGALDEHVPGTKRKINEMQIFAWGHSFVVPTIGSHSTLYPSIAAPFGDIHFANADNDITPGIENALGVAFNTAEEVAKKL